MALTDCNLGDVADVVATLPRARWAAAAQLLGFAPEPVAAVPAPDVGVREPAQWAGGTPRAGEPSAGTVPARGPSEADLPRLTSAVTEPVANPVSWLANVPPLPARPPATAAPPRHEPLLPDRTAAAVLAAAAATWAPSGRVDVPALVAQVARRRVGPRLPRLPRRTLSRGAHVLVDEGEAMAPFGRDVDALLARLRRVVGDGLVTGWFLDSPRDGVALGDEELTGYQLPPPGTPVLVVSDLGVGGPLLRPRRPAAADWVRFAARLRGRGSPVVALVPYPPRRWPRGVARRVAVVEWDRDTGVAQVLRARRRTGERSR